MTRPMPGLKHVAALLNDSTMAVVLLLLELAFDYYLVETDDLADDPVDE
jgi:hypothetical protein